MKSNGFKVEEQGGEERRGEERRGEEGRVGEWVREEACM